VPGFQPLAAYELNLHNVAPELERGPAGAPADFLARHVGEPHATAEVAAATGLPANETRAGLRELATHGVRRIAGGDEDELWCCWAPAVELRYRPGPAWPEPVDREFAACPGAGTTPRGLPLSGRRARTARTPAGCAGAPLAAGVLDPAVGPVPARRPRGRSRRVCLTCARVGALGGVGGEPSAEDDQRPADPWRRPGQHNARADDSGRERVARGPSKGGDGHLEIDVVLAAGVLPEVG
jgi:hypothetical protein